MRDGQVNGFTTVTNQYTPAQIYTKREYLSFHIVRSLSVISYTDVVDELSRPFAPLAILSQPRFSRRDHPPSIINRIYSCIAHVYPPCNVPHPPSYPQTKKRKGRKSRHKGAPPNPSPWDQGLNPPTRPIKLRVIDEMYDKIKKYAPDQMVL